MTMSLEDRSVYERLLNEVVNSELDVRRAVGRRHDAIHACIDFCVEYARRQNEQRPLSDIDIKMGRFHTVRMPIDGCKCAACLSFHR